MPSHIEKIVFESQWTILGVVLPGHLTPVEKVDIVNVKVTRNASVGPGRSRKHQGRGDRDADQKDATDGEGITEKKHGVQRRAHERVVTNAETFVSGGSSSSASPK